MSTSTVAAAPSFQEKLIALQANLLNFAFMLTSNRDDAHDLVQDTTLRALNNEDCYADNTNFKGWVLTIMHNIFVNQYRRKVRSNTLIDQTGDLFHLNNSHDSGASSPEGSFTASEITKAINSLPDDLRIPFSLHVSGYQYNEIADHMGVPMSTIKSRIHMIRKRLQGMFADYR